MRLFILTAAAVMAFTGIAKAESFAVVSDPTVVKECGTDCHMPFPPETLPQESWKKIIGNLSDHFGEDASLAPETVKVILDYHLANSNDVLNTRAASRWRTNFAPARIQDAPRFKKKHTGCSQDKLDMIAANEKVKSWSNCQACHPGIVRTGSGEDNATFLPRELRRCFDD